MADQIDSLFRSLPDIFKASGPLWKPEEYADILTQSLQADLELVIVEEDETRAERVRALRENAEPPLRNLAELFAHRRPPLDLLNETKDYTKKLYSPTPGDEGSLPSEVATYLYYAAIAAALVNAGQLISKLPNDKLRDGFRWSVNQPWNAVALTELFRAAIYKVTGK